MSPAPVPVILNRRSGAVSRAGPALAGRLHQAFAAAGWSITLHWAAGEDVAAIVARQADAPVIVVGGGDGTLGCAMAARRGAGTFGILPLGTRNHLARDLGIPFDLAAAVDVIVAGHVRAIDLATVNGQGFVNNASVGLYPLMVRHRDAGWAQRLPKWLATVPAAWAALARLPRHRMHLQRGQQGDRMVRTSLLFVGNNRYLLERGRLGQRTALDDGLLSVFAVAADTRLSLVGFALRAMIGRIRPDRDFTLSGDHARLIVRSRARTIDIALDGEVRRIPTPLRFAIAPHAIRVCVPATDRL